MNPSARRLLSDVPLIERGTLTSALAVMQGHQAAEHPAVAKLRQSMAPTAEIGKDGIAQISIEGVIARKPDPFEMIFFGPMEDSVQLLDLISTTAANPSVFGILMNIDSPGGFMTGGPEIADAVAAASKSKPVVAWTGGTMASLAYWIGSQARAIVASRSAIVGSIGVFTTVTDYTQYLAAAGIKVEVIKNKEADYKAAGVPGTSLTDAQRSYLQDSVQASFQEFQAAVTLKRRIEAAAMRGQTFNGLKSKSAGLVDAIGDRSYALSILRSLL